MKNSKLIFLFIFFLSCSSAFAKTHEVHTLNQKNGQSMTFDPMFQKIEVGDTLKFVHQDTGHTSESLFTPDNASGWKGKNDEQVSVTLNEEGLYIFHCQNHGVMGMVGVVQVGRAVNLDEAKEFLKKHKAKIALRKERVDELLGMLGR